MHELKNSFKINFKLNKLCSSCSFKFVGPLSATRPKTVQVCWNNLFSFAVWQISNILLVLQLCLFCYIGALVESWWDQQVSLHSKLEFKKIVAWHADDSWLFVFYFFTVCSLIEKLSLSKMPFKNDPIISKAVLYSTEVLLFFFFPASQLTVCIMLQLAGSGL